MKNAQNKTTSLILKSELTKLDPHASGDIFPPFLYDPVSHYPSLPGIMQRQYFLSK
jgi:hypothetical protein